MRKQQMTHFLPPGRVSGAELAQQISVFATFQFDHNLLNVLPDPLLILNPQRQIVFANRPALELVAVDETRLYGLRPGEALHCERLSACPNGCGTSAACSSCGLVGAILASLGGLEQIVDTSFTQSLEDQRRSFDLRVVVRPLRQSEELFALCLLKDISHEKRRMVLEHVFFHDLMNSLGSIRGLLDLLRTYDLPDRQELLELANLATLQAIDEIHAQRELSRAENDMLVPQPQPVAVAELIRELVGIVERNELAVKKELVINQADDCLVVVQDRVLLRRILLNMVKNALEATPAGGTVTIHCAPCAGDRVRLAVHNPGVILPEIRYRIFQRSFSTKGEGRGLGTYGMKLLATHVQGEVGFESTAESGTVFYFHFPRTLDNRTTDPAPVPG